MIKKGMSLSLSLLLILAICPRVYSGDTNHDTEFLLRSAGEHIRNIAANEMGTSGLTSGGEGVYVTEMLTRFYGKRNYAPAWAGTNGSFPLAETMLEIIEEVHNEGLVPEYYHVRPIEMLVTELRREGVLTSDGMAELDLLLTDSFLLLGCHFSAGCIDPVTIDSSWLATRSDLAVDVILDDALKENNIRDNLRDLLPLHSAYTRLRQRLLQLKKIVLSGGWPVVSHDGVLKKGAHDRDIATLKKRLIISADLEYSYDAEENRFDNELEKAVIRFQRRHSLYPDGILGPDTLRELNIPAERRLRQIEINLERMRWISRYLGHRYILVNIADFRLDLVDRGKNVMTMDVVVGKPYWNTPVFTKAMKYLVLNPFWNIPESIAREEILPRIKKNITYLAEQKIKILGGWSRDAGEIAPESILWEKMTEEYFPYILRQEAGPLNPLGSIKFMLPNKYNIYLHDSPARGLFSRNSRAFSHGCIRVHRPVDLAEYLLKEDPAWSREKIVSSIKSGEYIRIDLSRPINVHIVYLTAWVNDSDILQFRGDVYGRDEKLDRALRKKPSTLAASLINQDHAEDRRSNTVMSDN